MLQLWKSGAYKNKLQVSQNKYLGERNEGNDKTNDKDTPTVARQDDVYITL